MRKLWPLLAATALPLTGCGADAEPTVVRAPTQASAPATPQAATSEPESPDPGGSGTESFVATVREKLPEVAADRRDDEIAAVAGQACTSLAADADADTIIATTRSLGTLDAEAADHATARELIKLAIDTVCPDQDRRVDEF